MQIREATADDSMSIAHIYNQGIEDRMRGHGVGDSLLGALEQRARLLGYHKLVLAAFPTNAPGMRLYERHRFQTVGIYHEQGLLDGMWVDVIVMEKLLH